MDALVICLTNDYYPLLYKWSAQFISFSVQTLNFLLFSILRSVYLSTKNKYNAIAQNKILEYFNKLGITH